MEKSYTDSVAFFTQHRAALERLSKNTTSTLVICPSFVALAPLATLTKGSSIVVGAQHCSWHHAGPFTGQVDALSLAQAGCAYALVGHSEVEALIPSLSEHLNDQIVQLRTHTIIPIICIGETAANSGNAQRAITDQLVLLAPSLAGASKEPYLLAYEPCSAIGTGNIPAADHLRSIRDHIHNTITQHKLYPPQALLYGGSVNPDTIRELTALGCFDGYLIGSASLDFQTLEKIVSWSARVI